MLSLVFQPREGVRAALGNQAQPTVLQCKRELSAGTTYGYEVTFDKLLGGGLRRKYPL
jgi:hypothetical protein